MTDGDPANPVLKEAGVEHNDAAGRAFIKLSAMMGNVSACFWLGSVNYHGKCGFAIDKGRAYRHFDHGALAGNPTCGTGAGITVKPLSFIVYEKGSVRMMPATGGASGEANPYIQVMDAVPAAAERIADLIADLKKKKADEE